MRPAARLQAAIELLDEIIVGARDNGGSADNIAKKFFKARRYAGSKDRRAVREHVYTAIRRFGERPENARAAMVGLAQEDPELLPLFDGSDYGPRSIADGELTAAGGQIPAWLQGKFGALIDEEEQQALFERAPLHVRWHDPNGGEVSISDIWPEAEPLALPDSYALPAGTRVEDHPLYREGKVEIQDLGSQAIVAAAVQSQPCKILDLCAGAGGKTLGMAALLPENSQFIAADTDRGRLSRIEPRMRRARTINVETILLNPERERDSLAELTGQCDLVVVDAPCSGTGTWRRNPELRWRMTPTRLEQTTLLQQRLMRLGGEMVVPGGRLLYAVCSLLDEEGVSQTERFLQNHDGWRHIEVDLPIGRPYRKGVLLSPYHDGTDGFYFTCLEKL